jgi:hypothetical protein
MNASLPNPFIDFTRQRAEHKALCIHTLNRARADLLLKREELARIRASSNPPGMIRAFERIFCRSLDAAWAAQQALEGLSAH